MIPVWLAGWGARIAAWAAFAGTVLAGYLVWEKRQEKEGADELQAENDRRTAETVRRVADAQRDPGRRDGVRDRYTRR